jgi:superfamily II DNA helicase RecQ
VAEGKERFIDRLGPTLTSGLIIAVLSATSLGAVAVRDLVIATNVDIAYLKSDLTNVKSELEKFKSPGGRFTAADGAKHDTRIEKLEEFASKCQESKIRLDIELQNIKEDQKEVCGNIQNCLREIHMRDLHNGNTSSNNSSSNRSRN